ncbi:hypothetical protein TNCV_4770381 [Trichonephila clavipes]|nr:hypothetical protein TNCV_4770381 [Trichonephila clavipes]
MNNNDLGTGEEMGLQKTNYATQDGNTRFQRWMTMLHTSPDNGRIGLPNSLAVSTNNGRKRFIVREHDFSKKKKCVSSFRDARKRKRTKKAQSSFISVTEMPISGTKCGDFNAMQRVRDIPRQGEDCKWFPMKRMWLTPSRHRMRNSYHSRSEEQSISSRRV